MTDAPKIVMLIDDSCPGCKHKGTYDMQSACSNCGTLYTVRRSRGHESRYPVECLNCGCRSVRSFQ